jgi:hypothetical protein
MSYTVNELNNNGVDKNNMPAVFIAINNGNLSKQYIDNKFIQISTCLLFLIDLWIGNYINTAFNQINTLHTWFYIDSFKWVTTLLIILLVPLLIITSCVRKQSIS